MGQEEGHEVGEGVRHTSRGPVRVPVDVRDHPETDSRSDRQLRQEEVTIRTTTDTIELPGARAPTEEAEVNRY